MPQVPRKRRTGTEPPTEPFTNPPMTDAHPPIPETEPVQPEGTMTFMEPSPRRGGRDPTFSVEVEPEDAPGGVTPRGEVRSMRRDQAPPSEPEPGALDLFDKLRRLFEGVKLPEIIRPAESAPLPMDAAARMARAAALGFDKRTFFHGAREAFEQFEPARIGTGLDLDEDEIVRGFWFTHSRSEAEQAAFLLSGGEGGHVFELKLALGRQKIVDMSDVPMRESQAFMARAVRDAQAEGFNSVWFTNFADAGMRQPGETTSLPQLVLWEPHRIRSTEAAFDPAMARSGNLLAGVGGGVALVTLLGEEAEAAEQPSARSAPAGGITFDDLLLDGATGLESDDREAVGRVRLDRLRAELQEELGGTDAETWGKLFAFSDLGRSVGGGLRDAAQEVVDALAALQRGVMELGGVDPEVAQALAPGTDLPEVRQPETLAGEIARPLTSFIAGFIPMARAARAAGIGYRLLQDIVAAGAAGALTMPTDQPSIADSLAQIPGLDKAVPEFLLSDPGDSEAEAKAKRAIGEALGVGVGEAILRPIMAGLRFLRARRAIREAADLPATARQIKAQDVQRMRELFARSGSEVAQQAHVRAGFTREAAQRIVDGDLSEDALASLIDNVQELSAARSMDAGEDFFTILGGREFVGADDQIVDLAHRIVRFTPEQLANADPRLTARMFREGLGRRAVRQAAAFWTNSILLNPAGRILDFTTNLANTLLIPAENVVATTITRGPRAGLREAQATTYGLLQGIAEGFRLAGRAFAEGRSIVDPQFLRTKTTLIQPRHIREVIQRAGTLGLVGDFIARGAFRTIAANDDLFKTVLARAELHRLAAREVTERGLSGEEAARELRRLVAEPTDDMLRQALDVARYGTFTRPLGDLGERALAFRDSFPLGRFVVPFGRSPSNIIKFSALDRTPLAALTPSIRRDLLGQNGRHVQALAAVRIAEGTALLAMAAKWAAEGLITSGGPADPELRQLALGDRPPYSIRVGDQWVQFNRFSPIGSLLAYGADLAQVAGAIPGSEFDQLHSAAIVASYRNLLELPLFEGFATIAHVLEGMSRGDPNAAMRELSSIPMGFIPSGVGAAARALDPNMREARTLLDQVLARTPGWSEELPVRHDPLGEEIALNVGFSDSALERFLSPAAVRKDPERLRPVREFLLERGLQVGYPERSIMGVPIDSATHQRLIRRRGQLALPELRAMIRDPAFAEAPQALQQEKITTLFARAGRAAAAEIIEQDPLLRIRIEQVRSFEITPEQGSMRRGPLSLEMPR